MENARNRHGGSKESQKINFLLAKGRIVLINPDNDRYGRGFEFNFEVCVPEPFGQRLYMDDAARPESSPNDPGEVAVAKRGSRRGTNPARFSGCTRNHTLQLSQHRICVLTVTPSSGAHDETPISRINLNHLTTGTPIEERCVNFRHTLTSTTGDGLDEAWGNGAQRPE